MPGHAEHTALRTGQLTHTTDPPKWEREGVDWEQELGEAEKELGDREKP